MQSCHIFLKTRAIYAIFYANADPSIYQTPSWITLIEIELLHPIENVWSGRRYKAIPLIHEEYIDRDVLFLDADTLVFADKFAEIFGIIQQKSILIYGYRAADDAIWLRDEENNISLNLREIASSAGYFVENIHLNSGIIGRAADKHGIAFAETLARLLNEMVFRPLLEKSSLVLACNDEPYVSIAFQLVTNGTDRGHYVLDHDTYVTTAWSYLSNEESGWPTVEKPHLGLVIEKCAIIHFVGHPNFPFYLSEIERRVPLSSQRTLLKNEKAHNNLTSQPAGMNKCV